MLVLASHVFAILALTVAASWDLMTTEVPDAISLAVIALGVGLHGILSYQTGSMEPLLWSLGVGSAFSLYGWGMYLSGSWGGADAFVISAMGFAAPYSLSGIGILHAADMFINIMILGFLYAVFFALFKAFTSKNVFSKTFGKIKKQRKRMTGEVIAAAVLSFLLGEYFLLNSVFYFGAILLIIFMYRFLDSVEENVMTKEIGIAEVEAGDVLATDKIQMEHVREENPLGKLLSRFEKFAEISYIGSLKNRYGYSEIVGVTEEEIEKLESQDIEKVKVKTGIRFVPVFPLALFLTDMGLLGLKFIFGLIS